MEEIRWTDFEFGDEIVRSDDDGHLGFSDAVFHRFFTECGVESDDGQSVSKGREGRQQPLGACLREDQNSITVTSPERQQTTTDRLDAFERLSIRTETIFSQDKLNDECQRRILSFFLSFFDSPS